MMMVTTNETSMSGNAHTGSTSGQDHLHGLQDDDQRNAHGNTENVARQGGEHFEQYRDSAAEQIENLAQNAQSAAQQIDSNDTLGLSGYVTDMAQAMTRLADNLRSNRPLVMGLFKKLTASKLFCDGKPVVADKRSDVKGIPFDLHYKDRLQTMFAVAKANLEVQYGGFFQGLAHLLPAAPSKAPPDKAMGPAA